MFGHFFRELLGRPIYPALELRGLVTCALAVRLPNHSPVLERNRAPMGPEILSRTGAGVWRKAPGAFSDSNSVLVKFHSATPFA